MQIQSGAISYNQAIKTAVKQLADSGLKVVDYESGHRDQIDVAARRAVMTGVNQICAKYTEQSAQYLETPYFEVFRPCWRERCRGRHRGQAIRTGKARFTVFAQMTFTRTFTKCAASALSMGLEGANCRHRRNVWVDGVSERTYTDNQLEHIDDGLGCTFEGKNYTAYEATQEAAQGGAHHTQAQA